MREEFELLPNHLITDYKRDGNNYADLVTQSYWDVYRFGYIKGEINQLNKNMDSISDIRQAS